MVTAAAGRVAARRFVPGDGLLHPVPLLAIAVLVINDQVLKNAAPGVITGKLSDVAGMLFFPLFIVAVAEVVAAAAGRWHGPSPRWIGLAVAGTGLAFAAFKTIPAGEAVYEAVLGAAQWPFRALAGAIGGGGVPPFQAVELNRDPTDLVALAALWVPLAIGLRRAGAEAAVGEGVAARLRPYDLAVGGLSVALLAGATMDGWAHSHELLALESVITPWHALVYLAFAAVAFVLVAPMALARVAIPAGYGLSVAGLFVFTGSGLADTVWHLVFGIESSAEALLSPTHLGLGVGACLVASGPIRAAWLRADEPARWPGFLPALLSVVAIAGIVAFALHVANLFVDPWPRYSYEITDPTWYGPFIGIAAAIVPAGIVSAAALLLVARWGSLPAGSMTLLVGGVLSGLTFLHDEASLVGAPVLGGFLADLALIVVRPGLSRWRFQLFAFLLPALLFVAYFLVLWATGFVAWTAHLIGGTVVIAGGVGWALSILVEAAPRRPAHSRPAT